MLVKERIAKLHELMKKNGIDAYIVPSSDSHQSEYVAPHFGTRKWITGFTGSAGTAIITLNKGNYLWADGRYFIQAENQLKGSTVDLFKMGLPGVPTMTEWLKDNLDKGMTVGFDGKVISKAFFDTLEKKLSHKSINFKFDKDLIDEVWEDRDALPMDTFFSLDVKYAGKSRTEKLDDIRKHMQKEGMTHFVLTSLDDIAWLFNIRGNDVPSNPVILSYAVITMDKAILFVNPDKVTPEMKKELNSENVELKGYNDLCDYLKTLDKNSVVTYDADRTNVLITNSIPNDVEVIEEQNVTALAKAVKNAVEIENMKKAHIKDGVAMVKFLHWMDENVGKTKVTEVTADEKATEFRAQNENFMGRSFGTIAGYKEHAAMMHYSATPETAYDVQKEGMLLVDSGGQYLEGTTDITRTLVLGELTPEQKRDFTLVVRGVINLTITKFLQGATGSHLDALCRAELWKYGIDYKCGTGHGIGFFLNVHEGPHRIANGNNVVSLREGMMVTNEPGVYNEGRYGIRTENVILVAKDEKTEHGQFFKFETITMCPIDLRGIDKNYLAPEHIDWLNNYHKEVYEKLSPSLNTEEKAWLKNATRAI